MVEETLAGGEHHIAHSGLDHLGERAVALERQSAVGAVVAYHVDLGLRQFVSLGLVDPSLDGVDHLGVLKRVYMVPSAAVATVGREVAPVVGSLKGHAEVIAVGVERVAGVGELVAALLVDLGDEDIQSSQSGMAVAREVEVAVGAEGGKHLVAGGIDGLAQVFHAAQSDRCDAHAPDVHAPLATWHVGDEVQPLAVGRYGGVGIARQRVAGELQLGGLAPCGVAAVGGDYLCISGRRGIGHTLGEIHLTAVGADAARSLVVGGVDAAAHGFGLGPLALVVLDRDEDVGILGARDTTQLVALGLVARRGEVEVVQGVACQHRAVVGPSRVEDIHPLDLVARARLLDGGCVERRCQSALGQLVVGHRVEYCPEHVGSLLVRRTLEQLSAISQTVFEPSLSVSEGIGVGRVGSLRLVDALIAARHLERHLAALLPLLGRELSVSFAILHGGIIVFAQCLVLVAFAHGTLGTTAAQGEQRGDKDESI